MKLGDIIKRPNRFALKSFVQSRQISNTLCESDPTVENLQYLMQ